MDKEILKQIGMLDSEIEVYIALLRLGPSLVSRINKETGLHRTHIYDLLEKLREKGLISTFIKSGKHYFSPAPPDKLLQYIEEKKGKVMSILPELNDMTKLPKEETHVELFKGKEGLKTILTDMLNTRKDYCVMGSVKQAEIILTYALPQFLKKAEKLGMKERLICDKREKVLEVEQGSEIRYLDIGFIFPSSFTVYGNKVSILIWNPPYYGIVIDNAEVAQTYQRYFEFFWKLGKE